MNKYINNRIKRILEMAEQEMLDLHHPYVGTEHLLLSLLKSGKTEGILNKYNLTYNMFKDELINVIGMSNIKSTYVLYTPLLKQIIKKTMESSDQEKDELTLLKELIQVDDGIAVRIMAYLNIDLDGIYTELMNKHSFIDEIGVNLSKQENDYSIIGREKEITSIIEILLRKNKNNPVLVGEAGVGKSAIVYELAKRIKENNVPEPLKNKEIYMLDMASMLSNTKYRGEFETKINSLIKEVSSKENIILFIDEIHTIVRTGGGEGSCDAANILKPYLATNQIKLIGATTLQEYDEYISKDAALSRRFAKIYIKEPNEHETFTILSGVKETYENYHHIKVSDEVIRKVIDHASTYITTNQNPDKSLEVLDCLLSKVTLKNYQQDADIKYHEFLKNKDYKNALKLRLSNRESSIKEEDIIDVIETLANIKVLNGEHYRLLSSALDKKIYGQDLTKLKSILKRKCLTNKICSFEINGEKGVGKSYTAHVIASTLDYNLIELDMKEYTKETSINRLIGSDPGYVGYEDNSILDKIKYNPYSLILLKNYEYAHPSIQNLFTSVEEKGYLMDKKNTKVNFAFTMIIKTTEIKQNQIGYKNAEIVNDNIIHYKLINNSDMRKYITDNNLKLDLKEMPNTFTNLHSIMDEVFMNS